MLAHTRDCGHDPMYVVWEEVTLDTTEIWPQVGSRGRLPWRLFICDLTCSFWEVESHFKL